MLNLLLALTGRASEALRARVRNVIVPRVHPTCESGCDGPVTPVLVYNEGCLLVISYTESYRVFTRKLPSHTTLFPNSKVRAGMFYVCSGLK
jgi:hypothetical protein